MYKFALFVHILGAIGLFTGFGVLVLALLNLRRATATQAQMIVMMTSRVRYISGVSVALILLSGLYMLGGAVARHQPIGWMIVALLGFILMGVLTSVAGDAESKRLQKELLTPSRDLPEDLRQKARDPRAMTPLMYGVWLALGILVLMVFQPSVLVSVVVMIVSLLVAYFVSVRLGMRRPVID